MSPSVEEMRFVEMIVGELLKHKKQLCSPKWNDKALRIFLTNHVTNAALEYGREVITDNQTT